MDDRQPQQPEPPEADPDRSVGSEGGIGSSDAQKLPSDPTSSDSEIGDTDQHSNA